MCKGRGIPLYSRLPQAGKIIFRGILTFQTIMYNIVVAQISETKLYDNYPNDKGSTARQHSRKAFTASPLAKDKHPFDRFE
jgi:hypothetical protein